MGKILTRSGATLADVYDIEGSIAGVEALLTENVTLQHEMGGTILSERLISETRIFQTGDLLQSVNFEVFEGQPTVHSRIVALSVFADTASRIQRVMVGFFDGQTGGDTTNPIFSFETGTGSDFARVIRVRIGGSLFNIGKLIPTDAVTVPVFQVGAPVERQTLSAIGTTTAFGAGTVQLTVIVTRVFPRLEGISSRGLPVPSW